MGAGESYDANLFEMEDGVLKSYLAKGIERDCVVGPACVRAAENRPFGDDD